VKPSAKFVVQILFPLWSNQGIAFPKAYFSAVKLELSSRFHGLTAYSRTAAEGLWRVGQTLKRDEIIVYEVMADRFDSAWWRGYQKLSGKEIPAGVSRYSRAASENALNNMRNDSLEKLTQRNVETIARIEAASDKYRTFGEHISDLVAGWIGSWTFILAQTSILFLWMALNIMAWMQHWDPYPFILLNLALSFQAAFTGPVIMISQNRQSRLIEKRSKLDLQINLLAEQENTEIIRLLRLLCEHSKIDPAEWKSSGAMAEETKPDALIEQIEKTHRPA
jgi:uncharacterized membrane protein